MGTIDTSEVSPNLAFVQFKPDDTPIAIGALMLNLNTEFRVSEREWPRRDFNTLMTDNATSIACMALLHEQVNTSWDLARKLDAHSKAPDIAFGITGPQIAVLGDSLALYGGTTYDEVLRYAWEGQDDARLQAGGVVELHRRQARASFMHKIIETLAHSHDIEVAAWPGLRPKS